VTNAWLAAGLGAVVALDLALLWLVLGPTVARWRDERSVGRRDGGAGGTALDIMAIAALDPSSMLTGGVPTAAYDRVVRVASWAYLLSTAVVVYATGLWPEAEDPLLIIVAIGGIFILVAHDLLPGTILGGGRFVIEGAVAITIVSMIVLPHRWRVEPVLLRLPARRGRGRPRRPTASSPWPSRSVAIAAYLVAVAVAARRRRARGRHVAELAVNLAALVLLAYVRDGRAPASSDARARPRSASPRSTPSTGLANRAYILAAVEREIERATRYEHGFCVLMADLDRLKELNDTRGHRRATRRW